MLTYVELSQVNERKVEGHVILYNAVMSVASAQWEQAGSR